MMMMMIIIIMMMVQIMKMLMMSIKMLTSLLMCGVAARACEVSFSRSRDWRPPKVPAPTRDRCPRLDVPCRRRWQLAARTAGAQEGGMHPCHLLQSAHLAQDCLAIIQRPNAVAAPATCVNLLPLRVPALYGGAEALDETRVLSDESGLEVHLPRAMYRGVMG